MGTKSGNKRPWREIASMALRTGAQYDKAEFPELMDAIFWGRQILAIALAIFISMSGILGSPAIICFAVINFLCVLVYVRGFLGIEIGSDDTDWTSKDLLVQGFMPSFGIFLVVWTFLYNAFYV